MTTDMTYRLPSRRLIVLLAALLIAACTPEAPPAAPAPSWTPYDESAELAALALLPDDDLHFRQLNSSLRDKNAMWTNFDAELQAFGATEYQRMQPLVLEADVSELQEAVASGQFSYEALTLFYLYRIREIETDHTRYLNAVIATNPLALEQARAADQSRAAGTAGIDTGSLFGIPVLLKDNINAAGMATTAGAAVLQDNRTDNAFVVERLIAQGAVILGKANLSEWAYFFCDDCPSGWSAVGGQTLNPYGRFAFSTGGSSSGSGAAIAANLAAVALGSETSGSILSPASRHAVVGFKPTTGRLSRSGVIPISSTLDTTGPITRSVRDAIIVFNAVQGMDATDAKMDPAHDGPLTATALPLAGKRLGYLQEWLEQPLYANAIAQLEAAGASMIALDTPVLDLDGFDSLLSGEMYRDLAAYLGTHGSATIPAKRVEDVIAFNNTDLALHAPYGQSLLDRMLESPQTDTEVAQLAAGMQAAAGDVMAALFTTHSLDALLSINNRSAALAALANYPALTLPLGLDNTGQPQGLTLIESSWEEQALVSLALPIESLVGNRQPPAGY
jgi:amidase